MSDDQGDRSAELTRTWSHVAGTIARDLQHLGAETEGVIRIVSDASRELRGVFMQMNDRIGRARRKHDQDESGPSFGTLANDAVRLLQFEDACTQLAEHVGHRVELLRAVIGVLEKFHPGDCPTEVMANLAQAKILLDHEHNLREPHHLARPEVSEEDIVLF